MTRSEAMQGHKGILVLSPDGTLVFLHALEKLMASLAHLGTGEIRARDDLHNKPPSLRWERIIYMDQCSPERLRGLMGDDEVVIMRCDRNGDASSLAR